MPLFVVGRELPYPASGNFTKEFMEAHKTELINLVKFVDITMNNNRSSVLRYKDEKEIAGKIVEFLKAPSVVK